MRILKEMELYSVCLFTAYNVLCSLSTRENSRRYVGSALILLSSTSRDLHGERLRGEREGDLVRSMEGWLSLAARTHLFV